MNALKYNCCEASLLSQAVLKHVVSKENFNMWITSGLFCGSVGQMGQRAQPTFNIAIYSYIGLKPLTAK